MLLFASEDAVLRLKSFMHTWAFHTYMHSIHCSNSAVYYVCKSDHLSKFNTNTWILYKKHIYLYLFTTEKFGKLLKYIFKMHHKNMKATSETFTVSVKYYGGTSDLDFKHWSVMVQTFYLVWLIVLLFNSMLSNCLLAVCKPRQISIFKI